MEPFKGEEHSIRSINTEAAHKYEIEPKNYPAYIEPPRPKWSVADGRPPKKALTGYMIFVKERKLGIMQENPQLTFGQVMQEVADRWR